MPRYVSFRGKSTKQPDGGSPASDGSPTALPRSLSEASGGSVPPARLYVKLVAGRGLRAQDLGGTSDPYARVYVGERTDRVRARSAVVSKTLAPVWDETLEAKVSWEELRGCAPVHVAIYDHDKVGSDDFLGMITLDSHLVKRLCTLDGEPLPEEEDIPPPEGEWLRLHGRPGRSDKGVKGMVQIAAWYGPTNSWDHSQDASQLKAGAQPWVELTQPRVAHLRVLVQSARGLKASDATGTSDPFCVVRCFDVEAKTVVRSFTLSPTWNEEFVFAVPDPLPRGAQLQLDVYDYDKGVLDGNDHLGQAFLDLRDAHKEADGFKTPAPRWRNLVSTAGKLRKGGQPRGEISVALSIDRRFRHVNTREDGRHAAPRSQLATLTLSLERCSKLGGTTMTDTPDPYCVVKLGEKWFKTKTQKNTVYPSFDMKVDLPVYEPTELLLVGVFDDNQSGISLTSKKDSFLGKAAVRLSTLPMNKHCAMAYPLYVKKGGKVHEDGRLHMVLTLTVPDVVRMAQAYLRPRMPLQYYKTPISKDDMDRVEDMTNNIVSEGLASGLVDSNIGSRIRPEASICLLEHGDEHANFSSRTLTVQTARLKKSLPKTLMALPSNYRMIKQWRYPAATVSFQFCFIYVTYNSHLILPAIFTALFFNSLSGALGRRRKPPMPTMELLTGKAQGAGNDGSRPDDIGGAGLDADEEVPEKEERKGLAGLKYKYDKLMAAAAKVQNHVGHAASVFERLNAVLSWQDDAASLACMTFFLAAAVITYVVPFRVLCCLCMLYDLRHPSLRKSYKLPGKATCLFARLPHNGDLLCV